MVPHPNPMTIQVKDPLGNSVSIDVALAPLIRELWRLKIWTGQCCQEVSPGMAYIEFPGTGEAMEFLDIAQRNYKAELQTWDEGKDGAFSIVMRLLVYFPLADVARLTKACAGF